jgi:hypothetical protein
MTAVVAKLTVQDCIEREQASLQRPARFMQPAHDIFDFVLATGSHRQRLQTPEAFLKFRRVCRMGTFGNG